MIQYLYYTRRQPCTIAVKIKALRPCLIYFQVFDATQKYTWYINRFRSFAGDETQTLYAQIPISLGAIYVRLFEELGNISQESNFKVISVEKLSLPRSMMLHNYRNSDRRSFVDFAQRFSLNAGVLPAYPDKDYISDNGKFRIHYSEKIVADGINGLTPARIDIDTKVIEISRERFLPMTQPRRFLIELHEYAHLWENKDLYDELEADLNALTIYLGLGYPRIEAHETFLSIFEMALTDENRERYEYIAKFIDEFDSIEFEHL